jgi:hypothetical protein
MIAPLRKIDKGGEDTDCKIGWWPSFLKGTHQVALDEICRAEKAGRITPFEAMSARRKLVATQFKAYGEAMRKATKKKADATDLIKLALIAIIAVVALKGFREVKSTVYEVGSAL